MQSYSEITCSLCGCLCDDLAVTVEGDRITNVANGCPKATSVFQEVGTKNLPAARIDGIPLSFEEGIERAVEMLLASRAPLVFGMDFTCTDDQRAAVHLAETLGGVIDTGANPLCRAAMLAMQQTGISTCTLGEIRQRADLVILWGADPETTHPRFFERFIHPESEFLPNGRVDRTIISINAEETRTDRLADLVIRLPKGETAQAIGTLRYWLRKEGVLPNSTAKGDGARIPVQVLQELAGRMKSCRYGVLLFGDEMAGDPVAHLTLQSLFSLVAELNEFTRFTTRGLGGSGAENVLAWQTGFPLSVDFQKQYPRYQPGEFSAHELIKRGEVDCCVVIGSESLARLVSHSQRGLDSEIPTIFINPSQADVPLRQNCVEFTAAFPGVEAAGTMYRMDDVALPVRKVIDSPYRSVAEILHEIRRRVK